MKYIKLYIYKIALTFIIKRMQDNKTPLTSEHLYDAGWEERWDSVKEQWYFYEPNIKERDRVLIEFCENNTYRVWHGEQKTFIAAESSVEWLQHS